MPGVINQEGERVLTGFKWGLIPFWAKDSKIGYSMINARAESIQKKPAFRNIIGRKRVVVPSTGYYEWRKEGSEKQPYLFRLTSGKVFGFAGLYDTWKDAEGEWIYSCTIITTDPNTLAEKIHDRMPVILDEDGVNAWLDPELTDKDILQSMLNPYPADEMRMFPVAKDVNYVKNEGSNLIKEVVINSK